MKFIISSVLLLTFVICPIMTRHEESKLPFCDELTSEQRNEWGEATVRCKLSDAQHKARDEYRRAKNKRQTKRLIGIVNEAVDNYHEESTSRIDARYTEANRHWRQN